MSAFAAVLTRDGQDRWAAVEVTLAGVESVLDIADAARDVPGDLRLVLIEEDDEYAVIVRVDDADEPRVFLSDGHAADSYPVAALVADDLPEIGADPLSDDDDAPPAHDSAPFGDPEIVADLGIPGPELIAWCTHEGTLPIDVLVAVCERVGCGEQFDTVRV